MRERKKELESKILKNISIILKRSGIAASTVMLLGFSQVTFAAITPAFDNGGTDINLGHSHTFTDGAASNLFTVTAWGDIDQQKDDYSAYDQAGVELIENPLNGGCNKNSDGSGGYGDGGKCGGTIYLSTEAADNQGTGMGVQEGQEKTDRDGVGKGDWGGSTGISGKGQQRNEQVVFDFEAGVSATTITLTGWKITDDRAVLYIEGGGGTGTGENGAGGGDKGDVWDIGQDWAHSGNTAESWLGCTFVGTDTCKIDLTLLGLDLDGKRIAIRSVGIEKIGDLAEFKSSEFKIGSLTYNDIPPIPVPAAFWLFGTAIFGLIGMRRKAKLAA